MASDRASPPALRWVALFLAVCAGLGLWMGFKDQMRRNPPDWYTGASRTGGGPTAADLATEAKAYDPNARNDAPVQAAAPAPKAEEKKDEVEETDPTDAAASPDTPVTTAPSATPPGTAPATPRPKAPTTPSRPAPSEDPVGDILDSQRPAPEQPPVVPY